MYNGGGSPPATRALVEKAEGDEKGLPPLSQAKAVGTSTMDRGAAGPEVQAVARTAGVTTPSTLSDDAASISALEPESPKRQGKAGSRVGKRPTSRGGDSEGHETSEEGQDTKKRPRKSARLA